MTENVDMQYYMLIFIGITSSRDNISWPRIKQTLELILSLDKFNATHIYSQSRNISRICHSFTQIVKYIKHSNMRKLYYLMNVI
jgi:hypothetical protein